MDSKYEPKDSKPSVTAQAPCAQSACFTKSFTSRAVRPAAAPGDGRSRSSKCAEDEASSWAREAEGRDATGLQGSSANCSPVPRAARAGDREGLALQVGKLPQGACCSCFSSSKGMRPASTAAQRHQAQGDPGTD
eukprot:scaffold210839_cov19-Tisochrysis_lutea.AAC.1